MIFNYAFFKWSVRHLFDDKRQGKALVPEPNDNDLQQLMVDISSWSDATFGDGQRNPAMLHHLKKEVAECITAVEKFQRCATTGHAYYDSEQHCKAAFEEYADCFMLLLDSAYHFGLNADVLMKFTRQKLEINKQRKWGSPDENGVVEHIREGKKCMS